MQSQCCLGALEAWLLYTAFIGCRCCTDGTGLYLERCDSSLPRDLCSGKLQMWLVCPSCCCRLHTNTGTPCGYRSQRAHSRATFEHAEGSRMPLSTAGTLHCGEVACKVRGLQIPEHPLCTSLASISPIDRQVQSTYMLGTVIPA